MEKQEAGINVGGINMRRSIVFRAKLYGEVRSVLMKNPLADMRDIANEVGHSKGVISNAYHKIRASSEFQDWIKHV